MPGLPFSIYVDPEVKDTVAGVAFQPAQLALVQQPSPWQNQPMIVAPQSAVFATYWQPNKYYVITEKRPLQAYPWVAEGNTAYKMRLSAIQEIYEANDEHALHVFMPYIQDNRHLTHMVVGNKFRYSILDYAQDNILSVLARVGVIHLQ